MPRRASQLGFTLIELMIVVGIIGILSAIAIPNFIRFQAKSKQSEAKANLKVIFTAQRSQFQEHDAFATLVTALGFSPERGNRYWYQLGAGTNENRAVVTSVSAPATDTGVQVDQFKFGAGMNPTPAASAFAPAFATNEQTPPGATPGVYGVCPSCNFLAFAMGDVDNETTGVDMWVVSSVDFAATPVCGDATDTAAPAGVPFNNYDDASCP